MKRESRAPLIVAIVLLLLPVLYVGSYLALVRPGSAYHQERDGRFYLLNYRYFGDDNFVVPPHSACIAPRVFWPLEQIDRKVRPRVWRSGIHDMDGTGLENKFPH